MGMIRWDPFADMAQLREQVNRLFEQSLSQPGSEQTGTQHHWSPAVDILETPDAVVLQVEIAGVKPEQVDIQLCGDTLSLSGQRTPEREQQDRQYVRIERRYGTFQRSFTLGIPVDPTAVKAVYHDGILEIVLPKREDVKPKRVKIEIQPTVDATR